MNKTTVMSEFLIITQKTGIPRRRRRRAPPAQLLKISFPKSGGLLRLHSNAQKQRYVGTVKRKLGG